MSYQEKRTIASITSGVLVLAAYCIYVFGRYRSNLVDPGDLKFCGITMLIFIGIGIVATIVVQIVLHIALSISVAIRERNCDDKAIEKAVEAAVVEDEMDKLIELKAMKAGFAVAGVGFVAALFSLVFDFPGAVMLNILFLSFLLGSLIEGAISLYYYRAGVKNG